MCASGLRKDKSYFVVVLVVYLCEYFIDSGYADISDMLNANIYIFIIQLTVF